MKTVINKLWDLLKDRPPYYCGEHHAGRYDHVISQYFNIRL